MTSSVLQRIRVVPPLRHCMAMLLASVVATTAVSSAGAQVVDSVGAGVMPSQSLPSDSALRPPLSPARAFLYSFLLPGTSQSIMKRPTAMVIFSSVEVVGWAMLRRSILNLDRARAYSRDSVVAEYQIDPNTGLVARDPDTGAPLVRTYEVDVFGEGLVPARKRHVEDWAAILVFNHLMSGADALVASHLWDVPVQVGFRPMNGGGMLVGSIKW